MKRLNFLLLLLTMGVASAQTLFPSTARLTYSPPPANTIPGTPTDAYLIANYPAASYSGYTATTSDLGSERSDGTRWLILDPPVPSGASAAGFHTLIYAIHPIVADINILGTPSPGNYYFVNGYPGVNAGDSSSYYTTTSGQLTLINPGNSSSTANGNIISTATYNNGTAFASMNSALPFLTPSNGYYVEAAMTESISNNNVWSSFWIWTVEAMSGGWSGNTGHNWVELDINEWGFNPNAGAACSTTCGTTTSLLSWYNTTGTAGNNASRIYSSANLSMTNELIMGAAWDQANSKVEVWENGSQLGTITFASASLPTNAWSGLHHTILFGAGGHGWTATPSFNHNIRYVMAFGPP